MKKLIKTLSLTAIALLLIAIAGCEKSETPVPLTNKPSSQVPNPPDILDPENPEVPIPKPGQTPPDLSGPAIPGAIRKISWAALDFKTFEYNGAGDLVKYIRQYNYVQGTDIVQRDEFTYSYDETGKLLSVITEDGFRTSYTYKGEVWSEAHSYDKLNRPLRKYEFQFDNKKQLVSYEEFYAGQDGSISPRSKSNFTYNANGNLIRYVNFWFQEGSGSYVRSTDLHYSNFDSKKYPRNADSFNEVLQPLKFFVNNPGRKEIVGSATPIEYYTYSYDENGYPRNKQTSYSAEKPIAPLNASFEY